MRRAGSGPACRSASDRLRRAWLRLALAALAAVPLAPAYASVVRLHYEPEPADDIAISQGTEMEIKAAFLLKFPDFISWQAPLGDTLRIGVLGADGLLEAVTRLAAQQQRTGAARAIAVFRVSGPAAARRCHILVVGEATAADLGPILQAAHRGGALTVGDWNEPRVGAVIRIFRDGRHVRFEISQALAKEAGLRISSKLLNLSRDQSYRVLPPADALAQA